LASSNFSDSELALGPLSIEGDVEASVLGANWKVSRAFETKTFAPLFRRSLEGVTATSIADSTSSSSSWSNRPPEIFTRLLKTTSMVVAYIFDMDSPGITKASLWETYRQRCNTAMIAVTPPVSMSKSTSLTMKTWVDRKPVPCRMSCVNVSAKTFVVRRFSITHKVRHRECYRDITNGTNSVPCGNGAETISPFQ